MDYQRYSHLKIVDVRENHREFYQRFNPNAKSLCFKNSYLPDEVDSELIDELEIESSKWFNTMKIGNAWNIPQLRSLACVKVGKRSIAKVKNNFENQINY